MSAGRSIAMQPPPQTQQEAIRDDERHDPLGDDVLLDRADRLLEHAPAGHCDVTGALRLARRQVFGAGERRATGRQAGPAHTSNPGARLSPARARRTDA